MATELFVIPLLCVLFLLYGLGTELTLGEQQTFDYDLTLHSQCKRKHLSGKTGMGHEQNFGGEKGFLSWNK